METYEQFEKDLKDLLSWYQRAVEDHNNQRQKWKNFVHDTGFVIEPPSESSIQNARQSILTHVRRYEKRLRQHYGIL